MKLTPEDRSALQGAVRVLTEILQQAPPEVPDTIEEWPEDDTHLRGEFWKDRDGYVWGHGDGMWAAWLPHYRRWSEVSLIRPIRPPFTRTTDPSLPRTWDTLDDVPEDVERVSGDYGGHRRELTRSGLSESGWFQRLKGGAFRGWVELSVDRTKHVTNIRVEQ